MLASMKSDLRNMVTAEEGFFSDNQTYSTVLGAAQVNTAPGGACGGTVAFQPSQRQRCGGRRVHCSWVERYGDQHLDQRRDPDLRHLCRFRAPLRTPLSSPRVHQPVTKLIRAV